MEVTEDVKATDTVDTTSDKETTEPKRVIITEDDMFWLGNCSLKGCEQRNLL